jgi:hypothetical protein
MKERIPVWLYLTCVGVCCAVILFLGLRGNMFEDKYRASQLELADAYEAHANLIIKHVLTQDSLALCIAIVNPPPQSTPTEAAALFSKYVQQH